MNSEPQILRSQTMHARKGALKNRFTYPVDMVLIDPDAKTGCRLFSRNRFNLFSVHDADYGFEAQTTCASQAVRAEFAKRGLTDFELRLLTQPRVLGSLFNPVSFWLAFQDDQLVAFMAEVNNTFKERHFYLCHHDDFAVIRPSDEFRAEKVFYVSPFQQIAGQYVFNLSFQSDRYAIRIDFQNGNEGVLTTLNGTRAPMSDGAVLRSILRRPFGGLRVLTLIFYQAFKLKLKGAIYRVRPKPPKQEVSS